ncbi:MAG: discoidin domain-containing protein [Micromonosporaceae bacterium]|nr:discoidin domain-containing protein [Micromonosporaceae bacterium]
MLAGVGATAMVAAGLSVIFASAGAVAQAPGPDSWLLSTTDPAQDYAPTFTGNGYLAARVPAAGAGYSTSDGVETQAQLAGFYSLEQWEPRAALPMWTTLGVDTGAGTYGGLDGAGLCSFNAVCEAEDGQLSGGALVASDHAGYSGSGFVAGYGTVGATATVTVAGVPGAGDYALAIRYANYPAASGDGGACLPRTLSIYANGQDVQTATLDPTTNWDTWAVAAATVPLRAGDNTLALARDADDCGNVNVDWIAAFPMGGTVPLPRPPQDSSTSNYRQTLDMQTGEITTSYTWTDSAGHATDMAYTVLADRAATHAAAVSLTLTPHWNGQLTVVDLFDRRGLHAASMDEPTIDGEHATMTARVTASGSDNVASLVSVLRLDGKVAATKDSTVYNGQHAQTATVDVQSGTTYTATKFVGVASSVDTDRDTSAAGPAEVATAAAQDGAGLGFGGVRERNAAAWAALWSADIWVPGDLALTRQIRASMFYLLASARAGVDWSMSPAGLSSNGYNGHAFWDTETWMYPPLLALHPDIAASLNAYRQRLEPQYRRNAAQSTTPGGTPTTGARVSWESAFTGKESSPAPSTGQREIHISGDVALAQWQYYLATKDQAELRRAWPLISGIADFYASRAEKNPSGGGYSINDVMPPDEYHDHVDNSAYTNQAAARTMQIAIDAAAAVGGQVNPLWGQVRDGLSLPFDQTNQRHLEYDGYSGDQIKQADVTLLQYPWQTPMPPQVAQNDLDYYGPRTDPGGPSMTDAIALIDSAALGGSGCSVYSYLRSSIDPFLRGPFDQFSEARSGGAFTFTTGAGGFLQEFLYGFTGLRWNGDALQLDPSLPTQIPGVEISGLRWQGRTVDISVGPKSTLVTVRAGADMPLEVAGAGQTVRTGKSVKVRTRTLAGSATGDAAGCAGTGGVQDGWHLSTTDPTADYAPTFTGNGYFSARVPSDGAGFSSRDGVPTQAELAGFYSGPPYEPRASLPMWTTLGIDTGSDTYGNIGMYVCPFNLRCEGEDAILSGGAIVNSDHLGASGGKFVAGYGDAPGATTTFHVRAPAGDATIALRYANGGPGDRTISVAVNGDYRQLALSSTGDWDTWATVELTASLVAGDNVIAIVKRDGDDGAMNFDWIAAYPAGSDPPTQTAPPPSNGSPGTRSHYSQTLDLHTGEIQTSFTWTDSQGRSTDMAYTVLADQGATHVGLVRLAMTPHWSGKLTIVDAFDPAAMSLATMSDPTIEPAAATMTMQVKADGSNVVASLVSVLRIGDGTVPTVASTAYAGTRSQTATLDAVSGTTYTATKFVGVASSVDTDRGTDATPVQAATAAARGAADTGTAAVQQRNASAWSRLWAGDIRVPGDPVLTGKIRASMFYLLASARAGVDWTMSPGGLSSDGYHGHGFWDTETWMYPSLLVQHPEIARSLDAYRQRVEPQYQRNASGEGYDGAKVPWESALSGAEAVAFPWFTNEVHVSADVALAQWNYYLATADTVWLGKAWPLLSGIADFWVSRATKNTGGAGYSINNVFGPDEIHQGVNNSAYTNQAAKTALQIATEAARILGVAAKPSWQQVGDGLSLPFDAGNQRHLEFDGYSGDPIQQADVTMLQYPWNTPMSTVVAQNDLNYYVPRVSPDTEPAMSDAITMIDSATIGTAGCSTYTYMQRSIDPFMRGPFDQFQENRTHGAFTFTTGAGGYLQEFLYGYTGLRWSADSLDLNPLLPPQLPSLELTGLHWQGRTFDITIGHTSTELTLREGAAMPVTVGGGTQTVAPSKTIRIPTRDPNASPTDDLARCATVTATSVDPSYPASGAVDGTNVTSWRATSGGASLTITLDKKLRVNQVEVTSATGRTTPYTILGSVNGESWTVLGQQEAGEAATSTIDIGADVRYLRYTAGDTVKAAVATLTLR